MKGERGASLVGEALVDEMAEDGRVAHSERWADKGQPATRFGAAKGEK